MKTTFILFTSGILFFANSLHAYTILDFKTEISPGCEGGVLLHESSSFIDKSDELNPLCENLDVSDLEEVVVNY
jgi:hypothetical protein